MISTIAARVGTHRCQWPAGCPVNIPAGRSLCHFHAKPDTEVRQRHVLAHLRPADRFIALGLLEALTMEELAQRMGCQRRTIELAWLHIAERMNLEGKPSQLSRLALLRIVAGYDDCWCGV